MSQTQQKNPRKQAPRKTMARRLAKKTATVDATDLEKDVAKPSTPNRVARSSKRTPARRTRRKSARFSSALFWPSISMLNLCIDRAGKGLSTTHRQVLDAAKTQLRRLFRRPATQ
jgi:hypothetical protein